jgi:RNA polymerase sigma-B factor
MAELAREVDASEDHVIEALEAGVARQATSTDQPAGGNPDAAPVGDRVLGVGDGGYDDVEQQIVVRQLLDTLPDREREVIRLRFFENLTQPEIAERMGVSQSYLSRIIRRTLVDLRGELSDESFDE